jgi:hypothetical protein
MIATLIWTLAVASVPPVYTTSQLDEGILCVFALEKLGYGEVFSSFDERRRALFFQPSKMPSRGDSLMSAAVTSLMIGTEMLAFVFDK